MSRRPRKGKKANRPLRAFVLFLLGVVLGAAALFLASSNGKLPFGWRLPSGLRFPANWKSPFERKPRIEVPPGREPVATPSPAPRTTLRPGSLPPVRTPAPAPIRRKEAAPPADFEAAAGSGRGMLALVLDDLGYDDDSLTRLESFPGPLALAVIPSAPHAAEAAALARRKGWDLLVHLPMSPEAGPSEPEAIGPGDDDRTITARVERSLDRIPGAVGLNNHQGSRATADPRVVRAMLRVVRDRGLFFLDSRTTAASVAESEARALGISTIRRDVFLDDAATAAQAAGGSAEALAAAWSRALAIVGKKGHCVVIGHPHRETLRFLAARLLELDGTTTKRVRVSELVD